jgi:hypothetical protein
VLLQPALQRNHLIKTSATASCNHNRPLQIDIQSIGISGRQHAYPFALHRHKCHNCSTRHAAVLQLWQVSMK